jgi:hypothetical protein
MLDHMLIIVMRGGLTTAQKTMLKFGGSDQVGRRHRRSLSSTRSRAPAARGPVHRKNPIPNRTRTTGISTAILPGHDSGAMSSPTRMVKNEARS